MSELLIYPLFLHQFLNQSIVLSCAIFGREVAGTLGSPLLNRASQLLVAHQSRQRFGIRLDIAGREIYATLPIWREQSSHTRTAIERYGCRFAQLRFEQHHRTTLNRGGQAENLGRGIQPLRRTLKACKCHSLQPPFAYYAFEICAFRALTDNLQSPLRKSLVNPHL